MAKTPKLIEWAVMGRVIGQASGWDQSDTFVMQLYDFKAAPNTGLPDGDSCFDFEAGLITFYNELGEKVAEFDMVDTLRQLPRKEPVG